MTIRKILLICGGLEPALDGVGDYCRQLAAQLTRLGVECAVMALNDRKVDHDIVVSTPESTLRYIRIPSGLPSAERYAHAAEFLLEWQPDWVSLQFVAYGFEDRGLPFGDVRALPLLLRGQRVHFMAHELWLGVLAASSAKERLVGTLQRFLVLRLVRRLEPLVIQTSTAYLREALARAGLQATLLPLFGNIPVDVATDKTRLSRTLLAAGGPDTTIERDAFWIFGIFGSIPAHWPVERLLDRLRAIARGAKRRVLIVSAGQAGAAASYLFERWRQRFPDIEFHILGPKSQSEISTFLQSIDFGLSPYPECLLGKSGAAAAMFEHGLPVIVGWGNSPSAIPATDPEFEALIWRDDGDLETRLNRPPPRHLRCDRSLDIARSFLISLEHHQASMPGLAARPNGSRAALVGR